MKFIVGKIVDNIVGAAQKYYLVFRDFAIYGGLIRLGGLVINFGVCIWYYGSRTAGELLFSTAKKVTKKAAHYATPLKSRGSH